MLYAHTTSEIGGAFVQTYWPGSNVPGPPFACDDHASAIVRRRELNRRRFERLREHITPAACRANAERFSAAVFRRAFMAEVTRTIAASGWRLRVAAAERIESDLATEDLAWPVERARGSSWGR